MGKRGSPPLYGGVGSQKKIRGQMGDINGLGGSEAELISLNVSARERGPRSSCLLSVSKGS